MARPSGKRRLVVGGGRSPGFPRLRANDVSLNLDADAQPHVQADINRSPFEPEAFDEVYFEKIPYDAFTGPNVGAIKEVARILRPGGRLVIETGRLVPIKEVRTAMRNQGFRYVKVTDRGYVRITGRLRKR